MQGLQFATSAEAHGCKGDSEDIEDVEDESPKPKKLTVQKGRKHMTRLYSSDPPASAAQPPRNTLQKTSTVRSLRSHAWHVILIRDSS